MNQFLTIWRARWRSLPRFLGSVSQSLGRLITQASAWAARITPPIRAALSRALAVIVAKMDQAQRVSLEFLYNRRMAVKRFFLSDPLDPSSPMTREGRLVLAHWFKQARMFNHDYAPELNSEFKGMQKMLDIIMVDIFGDLPSIAQQMADEERRQQDEIVHA